MHSEFFHTLLRRLERAKLALAQRSDVEGEELRHDVRGAIAKFRLAENSATLEELGQLRIDTTEVLARVATYASTHGLFLAREGTESSEAIEAVRVAQLGPIGDDVTLVPCPACVRCHVCKGTHMTTASLAEAWRDAQEEE